MAIISKTSLCLFMGLFVLTFGGSDRYETDTGSYTSDSVDEVLSDEDLGTEEDLWGRTEHTSDSDSYLECADKLACSGDSIDEEYVYCDGYYGCYEAEVECTDAYIDGCRGGQETEINADEDIYCGGYVGCFMGETNSGGDTICDGLYGCYNSVIYSTKDIYLLGYRATTASEVYGNNSNDDVEDILYSYGLYGALYSVITDVDKILNYGGYGLYFGDIFTGTDTEEFTMVNYGRYSTYYAQVYCSHKTTCYIYCRDTGCSGLEVRVARKGYAYIYYENPSCDSTATVITAISSKDEDEWMKLFSERKEMKKIAKKEFKAKYGRNLDSYNEREFEELNIHEKFIKIIEDVKDRMGLINGKTDYIAQKDKQLTANPQELNSNNNVYYVSGKHNNLINIDWKSTAYGVISGVVLLLIGVVLNNTRNNCKTNKKLIENNTNSYTYQSI